MSRGGGLILERGGLPPLWRAGACSRTPQTGRSPSSVSSPPPSPDCASHQTRARLASPCACRLRRSACCPCVSRGPHPQENADCTSYTLRAVVWGGQNRGFVHWPRARSSFARAVRRLASSIRHLKCCGDDRAISSIQKKYPYRLPITQFAAKGPVCRARGIRFPFPERLMQNPPDAAPDGLRPGGKSHIPIKNETCGRAND
jgi:hypothetical protein